MSWIEPEIEHVPHLETKFRRIKSQLPCKESLEYLKQLSNFETKSMQGQFPLLWSKAIDYNIYDLANNKWIDFTSTAFVTNTGHSNPYLKQKIINQLNSDLIHTYAYPNIQRAKYCKKLIEFSQDYFEKCYLVSAGTEATDSAIKLMRLHANKTNKGPYIITFKGNWHGRTMGAQFLSSNEEQKAWIGHKDPYIIHLSFPYEWENDDHLKRLREELAQLTSKGIDLKKDIAGFFLETFQGWCANFYPKDFINEINNLCKNNNILLGFDEIQSGFGRTGEKFGFNHYGVKPDLICIGKGMGGGFPLSGILAKKEIIDLPEVGDMSSTHSANPISCTAGLAVLEELEENNYIENSKALGLKLFEHLNRLVEKYSIVKSVHGRGLLAGIIIQNNNSPSSELASSIVYECYKKGVLFVHTNRPSIKLAPPLSISEDALKEGLSVLEEVISNHD